VRARPSSPPPGRFSLDFLWRAPGCSPKCAPGCSPKCAPGLPRRRQAASPSTSSGAQPRAASGPPSGSRSAWPRRHCIRLVLLRVLNRVVSPPQIQPPPLSYSPSDTPPRRQEADGDDRDAGLCGAAAVKAGSRPPRLKVALGVDQHRLVLLRVACNVGENLGLLPEVLCTSAAAYTPMWIS